MKRNTAIGLFYTGVAAISIGIVSIALYLRPGLSDSYSAPVVKNTGKETAAHWFEIGKDLDAINQDGRNVKLSDLKGKVWIVAEFFAVCPHCAVRNGEELRKIYDEFKDNPDFQIVCISVDPENDKQEKLADYAKALNADSKNWWFLNAGDVKTTHEYLEEELKFFGIRTRTDPMDIETNGRYSHDLGFLLVDRDFQVVGKWPLADARSEEARQRDPNLYERLKKELFDRIHMELNQKK
ncbi:MAG: SCO family protein [Gloeobacteraceae cyanobacterium ES-bin-144]|nr:SCO family protein [Verrucomicrobiales bacterium]